MYRVMVVDDEPASVKHICNIIKTRCPNFAILGTARNGEVALEMIQCEQPDVVFSDVMMPIKDGIQLVTEPKMQYPDIYTIIVSGYSEFSYAKDAISAGVCKYILKPVRPVDISSLLEELRQKLDEEYYKKRLDFIRKISSDLIKTNNQELTRLFSDRSYYAAIYRKNGLPSRSSARFLRDMYSMPQERMLIYGRDEMEALYLCPQSILDNEEFYTYFERLYNRKLEKQSFYTAVVKEEPFLPKELPDVVGKLYKKLDESIVIGKNQMILLKDLEENEKSSQYYESLELLEYYIRIKDFFEIKKEIIRLFQKWETDGMTQLWVEESVHYLLSHFQTKGYVESFSKLVLDDIFAETISMEELAKNIFLLICPGGMEDALPRKQEDEFQEILHYLENHMGENISAQLTCKRFAKSQTTLSKLFHKYTGNSFTRYLGKMRMEKARKIMDENNDILIRDVAEIVGYSDQFYFSRVFHSTYGISPSEYMDNQTEMKGE